MIRLHARNPLLFISVAIALVVFGLAMIAPHLALRTQSAPQTEAVSVERSVYAPPQASMAIAPKLSVRAPHPNASATMSSPSHSSGGMAPLIARKGSISLIVGNVNAAVNASAGIAKERAGDVFSLQSSNDGSASPSADMSLRVPAQAFDATIAALANLGTVKARTIDAQDVTGEVTDSEAKLRNLRRTESDIRTIMDRSGTVGEVMDAESKLSDVREQIETLESEVKATRNRVAYSTVDVHFEAEAVVPVPDRSASAQLRNTFVAAAHALADLSISIVAALIWIAVFIPYTLLALGMTLAIRLFLRKRYTVRR